MRVRVFKFTGKKLKFGNEREKKITWAYYSCVRVDDSSIVKIENASCKDRDAHTNSIISYQIYYP